MDDMEAVEVQPIGVIRNNAGKRSHGEWSQVISRLIIDEKYAGALDGLEAFSHINVLFYLHKMERDFVSLIHPTGNPDLPLVGAFSTRTPNRPSKIGLTIVPIEEIRRNIIYVRGLDAYNGSPLLDIKPYFPRNLQQVNVPEWSKRIKKRQMMITQSR
ncbi:MAG: tRNA (N6-threonylcarbamoyladenosine(37)-N6)-methyltransferase TrmO [Candidatus Bathyarchaeia archaeon]